MATFGEWLQTELRLRKLKAVEFARLARLDPGAVSRILKDERKPNPETLQAISDALKLPYETVFRAAVGKVTATDESPLVARIRHLAEQLPEAEQRDVEQYIELRLRIAEERGKYNAEPKAKPAKS